MASFDHTFVSHVIDVDIVYCRNAQCKERFMKLREKALNTINNPITPEILEKTKKHLDAAFLAYGKMMLEEEIGAVRQLSGEVLSCITNTVCFLNHNYFKLGTKHQLEEMLAMERVPKHFEEYFNDALNAVLVHDIKEASAYLIKTVKELYEEIENETLPKKVPTQDIRGTYEEIWSNWKNKILYAAEHKDILLAFSSGVACQEFYNEMHKERGTVSINLMQHFQSDNILGFAKEFEKAMQLYKEEYDKLEMKVRAYDSIEEFRNDYLKKIN
jgi:hypothetical protein